MPKRERPDLSKDWPAQTRKHYIKLFSLQERLRARLKLAQELAVHNLETKFPGTNPRKTNPIPIVGKQQPGDYLKKYIDEQLPHIRYYLSRMQGEIEQIKRAFASGRHPNWYKQALKVEDLTVTIWEKMDDIQVHLLLTLKGDYRAIRESNKVVIDETRTAIETALQIRKELDLLRPGDTTIGLDEFGIYEIIIDLAPQPQHYLDLTQLLWHRSQQKKKLG